jgi:hypothetical protein
VPADGHRRQRVVLAACVFVDARARYPQERRDVARSEEGFGEQDGCVVLGHISPRRGNRTEPAVLVH